MAEEYDATGVAALDRLAATQPPVDTAPSGFGVFSGASPVLYLAVVPTGPLLACIARCPPP